MNAESELISSEKVNKEGQSHSIETASYERRDCISLNAELLNDALSQQYMNYTLGSYNHTLSSPASCPSLLPNSNGALPASNDVCISSELLLWRE